jgi:hypothetical protein
MPKTPTRITVEVTEDDILRAHRNDSYKCVVSQAIARTVPKATNIETDTQTVRFSVEGERRIYLTPYAVQGYVIAFDAGDPIEPFSFQLRDPKRIARKIRTETGKEAALAAQKARRKIQKSAKSKGVAVVKEEESASARAAYRAVAEASKDKKMSTERAPEKGGSAGPPLVFKRKRRMYGHRLLRINRLPGDAAQSEG